LTRSDFFPNRILGYLERLNMKLNPTTEQKVEKLIASGRFKNADQFVEQALEFIDNQDEFAQDFISRNKAYLEKSLAEAQQEPAVEVDDATWDSLHDKN